jgi:hypothetical protein
MLATPGGHPLATLAERVGELTGTDPTAVVANDPARFGAFLIEVANRKPRETPPHPARIVLIIDQFEETFTECQNKAERQAFITALCAAADSPAALVVLGMRADFYERCLAYPALLANLQQGHLPLGPMSADQLRQVITGPAAIENLALEPELVELLLRTLGVTEDEDTGIGAAGYDPCTLPLLAHALRASWQQRDGPTLTVAGYQRTGGIRQALATTAERAYSQLSPAEQQLARQILLRLVNVSDQSGIGDTLRRLPWTRLIEALPGSAEAVQAVLETFARDRLVTFDADRVEITHETLLWAWPRLAEWIRAAHAGLRTHQQLGDRVQARINQDQHEQTKRRRIRHLPQLVARLSQLVAALRQAAVVVLVVLVVVVGLVWFFGPSDEPCRGPEVMRSGPFNECVGVTDGAAIFAPELGLQTALAKIRQENEAVVGSGAPFVSIGYVLPLPRDAASRLLTWLRLELEGAYLAQWRANHHDGLGDTPLIRLLVVNVGDQAGQQSAVIPRVIQRVADPADHLVAVAGLGQSLEATKQAIRSLSNAGIPMIASALTADDLSTTPGQPVRGLFRISSPNSAQAAAAARILKPVATLLIQDTNRDDTYTNSLAAQFHMVFTTPPAGKLLEPERFDSSLPAVDNTFVQMMPAVCTEQPVAIYYAGRSANLPGLLAALAGRPCPELKIDLYTGDDAADVTATLRQQLAAGNHAGIAADMRTNITLHCTGLAHPGEWSDPQRFLPASTRIFQQDCATCFARVFPKEQLDHGGAIIAYDALLVATRAIRSGVSQQGNTRTNPSSLTPGAVLQQISRINHADPVNGASGPISFDEQGKPTDKPIPILQLNPDGTVTFIRFG